MGGILQHKPSPTFHPSSFLTLILPILPNFRGCNRQAIFKYKPTAPSSQLTSTRSTQSASKRVDHHDEATFGTNCRLFSNLLQLLEGPCYYFFDQISRFINTTCMAVLQPVALHRSIIIYSLSISRFNLFSRSWEKLLTTRSGFFLNRTFHIVSASQVDLAAQLLDHQA